MKILLLTLRRLGEGYFQYATAPSAVCGHLTHLTSIGGDGVAGKCLMFNWLAICCPVEMADNV